MHFLNLDRNETMSSYFPIKNFACDFHTINNYITSDRKLLFERYWDRDTDFDHPDFVSITVAWTYRTQGSQSLLNISQESFILVSLLPPDAIYSGLHGLPKLRMNPGMWAKIKPRSNFIESSPLLIILDYN